MSESIMSESAFSWLLVIELAFPFFALALILAFVLIRSKSRYKDAMRELIINVKDNEFVQLDATKQFLKNNLGMTDESAEANARDLIKERKFFFRAFVNSILNKDVENLAAMDDELSRVTARYHLLVPGGSPVSEAAAPAIIDHTVDEDAADALASELESKQVLIEELQQEKKALNQELHITMVTLNNIFAEYSSMFGEDVSQRNLTVEQILTAMESFSGPKAQSETPLETQSDLPQESELTPINPGKPLIDIEDPMAKSSNNLDDLALEQIEGEDVEQEEEPSWDDAFAESGDKKE